MKLRRRKGDPGPLRRPGQPVFTFVDDTTSPIADTEVLGWPTTKGTFISPESVWMSDAATEAHQPLLSIAAEVLPSLDQGQQAVERVVLEIHQGEMVDQNAQLLADQWALLLRDELERKKKVTASSRRRLDLQRARALAGGAGQRSAVERLHAEAAPRRARAEARRLPVDRA